MQFLNMLRHKKDADSNALTKKEKLAKLEEVIRKARIHGLNELGKVDDSLQTANMEELTEVRYEVLEEIGRINNLLLRLQKKARELRSTA